MSSMTAVPSMPSRRPIGQLFRKAVQPIFQDPASSLNPRMRVDTTLSNVLLRHGLATRHTLDADDK